MEKIINGLIPKLDKHLEVLKKRYTEEVNDYITNSKNKTNFIYERMLSVLSNNYLASVFSTTQGIDLLLDVSEFPIELENMTKEIVKELRKEVDFYGSIPKWNKCYIDGYFKLKINNTVNHLFVEYKINDKFKYSDLAKDFLKYKLYTYECKIETAFCYIVFDSNKDYPSILSQNQNFCILDSTISRKEQLQSNVFFHKGNINAIDEDSYKKLNSLVLHTSQFSKRTDKLSNFKGSELSCLSNKDKKILEILPKFNSRVIKASKIRDNYGFIKDLWEKCEIKDEFKEIIKKLKNEYSAIQILKESAEKIYELDRKISDYDKVDAERRGIRGSSYTSLNFLALLEFFAKELSIDYIEIEYGYKRIGRGTSKQLHEYRETANHRIEKLKDLLEERHFIDLGDLRDICIPLIYFIVYIYGIFYEIDDNNKIVKEKDISKFLKLIEEIQEISDKITKLMGINRIKIKDIIEQEYSDDIINEILKELFVNIYNEYK